jgi:hypothetical protein
MARQFAQLPVGFKQHKRPVWQSVWHNLWWEGTPIISSLGAGIWGVVGETLPSTQLETHLFPTDMVLVQHEGRHSSMLT